MKRSGQFRKYIHAWRSCSLSANAGKIFLPFMGYAGFQIGILLMLIFFAYPPFSTFLIPMIRIIFGEPALHYPNNFVVLPFLFTWANLLLSGLLGIAIIGTSTALFSHRFHNQSVNLRDGFRKTFRNYAKLLAVWFIETSLLTAIFVGVPKLLGEIEYFQQTSTYSIQLITALSAMILAAMFAYTTALIILDKKGVLDALSKSLSLFKQFPIVSFVLVAVPNLIKLPFEVLSGKSQFLASKFIPEMVAVVIIVSIIASMFSNYLLVGTVTRYFLSVRELQRI